MTYTPPSISGYNATPPSDDGSATTANQLKWSMIKTKLADPIKTYVDAINTAVAAAFTGQFLSNTDTKSISFTVGTTDDGKFYYCDSVLTATLPPAASAGEGFHVLIMNASTGTVTIDGDGSETINGSLNITLLGQYDAAILVCNGTAWYAVKLKYTSRLNGAEQTLASAGTTDLGTAATNIVLISGTTTITAFGSTASTQDPLYFIRFSGALTLTHDGTSLILPSSANITTANGDTAVALYLGSGNWKVLSYTDSSRGVKKYKTFQYLTSGTAATYTTPTNCKAILVKMVAGGGGGGATATNSGSNGSVTIFNSIEAAGGAGGKKGGGADGQGGYSATSGTGSASLRVIGNAGFQGQFSNHVAGGNGGGSFFGGATLGQNDTVTAAGTNANANTGAGGSGAAASGSNYAGGGGQAGEYVEIFISSPSATYTYTIGAGGNGGSAGTNAGGNGGSGLIIVEEFY